MIQNTSETQQENGGWFTKNEKVIQIKNLHPMLYYIFMKEIYVLTTFLYKTKTINIIFMVNGKK